MAAAAPVGRCLIATLRAMGLAVLLLEVAVARSLTDSSLDGGWARAAVAGP
jgi:hypothetical protein